LYWCYEKESKEGGEKRREKKGGRREVILEDQVICVDVKAINKGLVTLAAHNTCPHRC